jgi:biofilm protein TabA
MKTGRFLWKNVCYGNGKASSVLLYIEVMICYKERLFMIFDTFDHYTVYLGLNPALDAALQTLAQQLQQPFDPEKEQLAGGGWFFGTQYGTRARTELKAEAHQKYIDVMAAADGEETIYWKPVSELQTVLAPYDPEIEALLAGVDSDAIPLRLHPGRFVVFFPEDAHAPGGMSGTQSSTIKKYIAKVPI